MIVQDGDRTHCIVHRGSAEVDGYFDAYFLRESGRGSAPCTSRSSVTRCRRRRRPPGR